MTVPEAASGRTRGPVLVIGTGLLGASVGLGLARLGVPVLLQDASPSAAALARDLGAGRLAGPGLRPALVVVAAPPDVIAEVVGTALRTHPEAVVTDVASVKSRPLAELEFSGADVSRYIGGHPLAGRERSGAIAARGDLFEGRPWVLTPTPHTRRDATELARDLVLDLGALPVMMDAAAHDAAVATVSHVPQVLASLVAARLVEEPDNALGLAGQGLRDTTRIAASDPGLWIQILGANAAPVAGVLSLLRDDLDATITALTRLAADEEAPGARADLARMFDAGVRGHARIPGKHGSGPVRLAAVNVQVPDVPGEIGRVLAAMGEAGVNLEDLRIEHVPGRQVGIAEISVLPGAREELLALLARGGWQVAG